MADQELRGATETDYADDNIIPIAKGAAGSGLFKATIAGLRKAIGGSGGGGGGGGGGTALIAGTSWRIVVSAFTGQSYWGFAELQFIDANGVNLSTGGNAFADTQFDGGRGPAQAFDGNVNQNDQNGYLSNAFDAGHYIGYTPAAAISPVALNIFPLQNTGESNMTVQVQYKTATGAWTNIGDPVALGTAGLTYGQATTVPIQTASADGGSGGSGSAATTAPTIVQKVSGSQKGGNLNLTLPANPTPGNVFVVIWTGSGGNNPSDLPVNFTTFAFAANGSNPTQGYYPGNGQIYQGAYAAYCRVNQGDGPTLTMPCGSDQNNFLLLEVTDFDVAWAAINRVQMDNNTQNGIIAKRQRPAYPALHLAVLEQDNGDAFNLTSSGATKLADIVNAGQNHYSVAFQLTEACGDIKGSFAAAPKYVEIIFVSLAKYNA